MAKKEKEPAQREAPRFSRAQLLTAVSPRDRDIYAAVLSEAKRYTKAEAAQLAQQYREGKVS